MKRLLIFLIVFSLFAACNNDKGNGRNEKRADYREKDDYGNNDDQSNEKSRKDDDSNNDENTSSDGWTEKDKSKFLSDCMGGFGDKQALGKKICACALEKFEKKYTSLDEANEKGGEAAGTRYGKECMTEMNISTNTDDDNNSNGDADNDKSNYSVGGWPQVEKDGFMTNCEKKAIEAGRSRLVAQSYCECMLDKIETLYPDINVASKLTDSQLDRVITKYRGKCLEEN